MGIDYIKVSRLKEYLRFPFNWDGVIIDIRDVQELIDKVDPISEHFPDIPVQKRMELYFSKEWHVGRIKFFVENPNEITPISVDNDCSGGYISGYPIIEDGHHRIMAAIMRNDETIPAYYSGSIDTLEYLTGETDVKYVN